MGKSAVKNLPRVLQAFQSAEEVKAAFVKAFDFKLGTRKRMDLYTPEILFEFKCDKNFAAVETRRNAVATAVTAMPVSYC